MQQVGFLLDDLSQSQLLTDILRSAQGREDCVSLFCRRVAPAWETPHVGVFSWADAWGVDIPLVATCLDGAYQLQRFPATPRRYFYLNDLEWLRHDRWGGAPPYHALAAIYRSPLLRVVCRSEEHAQITAEAFNIAPSILNDFNIDYFING